PTTSTLFPYTTLFRSCTTRSSKTDQRLTSFNRTFCSLNKAVTDHSPHRTAHEVEFKRTGNHRYAFQQTLNYHQCFGFTGFLLCRSEEHTAELQSRENL